MPIVIWNFFSKYWKELTIIVLLFMQSRPAGPVVEYIDRVEIKVVEKEVIKWKTQVKEKIRVVTKPDGTRIETKENTAKEEGVVAKETKTEIKEEVKVTINPEKTQYGLGIEVGPDVIKGEDDYAVNGKIRLGETNLWMTSRYHLKDGISLGVELEF